MQLPKVTSSMDVQELANLIAIVIKELTWLMNGHVNANHIEAKSITAEKMKVNELSAISANLGKIIAGEVYGILIQGSQFQTNEPGIYPRVELSSTENLIKAELSSSEKIEIKPFGEDGSPTMNIENAITKGFITALFGDLLINTIVGNGNIQISSGGNLRLSAQGQVIFQSWSKIFSSNNGQTLQQALDSLSSRIADLGG